MTRKQFKQPLINLASLLDKGNWEAAMDLFIETSNQSILSKLKPERTNSAHAVVRNKLRSELRKSLCLK